MIFNSLIFIFFFLPVSIIAYYLMPFWPLKNIVLLVISLLFYSWSDPFTLILLLLSIFWNYLSGLELSKYGTKNRLILISSIAFNIAILFIYKYAGIIFPFDMDTSHVPMGLSFFTFSSISYLADIALNKAQCQKNILLFALYISFFGKLSSGPIVAYSDMSTQLAKRSLNQVKFNQGLVLFLKGLIKKILFADQFAVIFSSMATNNTVLGTWLYAISYALQLYFDFSGYSDMAIGISKIFGFEFKPNFDHPYMSKSIQEFFRRWHISLGNWFKNYVYIPLGGSRVNTVLYIRNILIVWLLTGIWHGANLTFIIWGLYLGVFILLERFFLKDILDRSPSFLAHLYVLLVILFGWVFFFSPSLSNALATLLRMFGMGASSMFDSNFLFVITENIPLIFFGTILTTSIYDKIQIIFYNLLKKKAIIFTTVIYILFFILCISLMIGNTYQSFLYSAF